MKRRTLNTIAGWINTNLPDLLASITGGRGNTDSKVGRRRTRLTVISKTAGKRFSECPVIFDHNAAEDGRCNAEVEAWLESLLADRAKTRPATRQSP